MTVWAQYKYLVDWDNDGDFNDAIEDISAFVRQAQWSYGRDRASQLTGRCMSSTCRLTVDNSDSRFSAFNSGGPLYGNLKPKRRIKIQMSVNGVDWTTVYGGYIETIRPKASASKHTATADINGVGPLTVLNNRKLKIAMHTSIKTGAAITDVLTEVAWAGGSVIDTGRTTMHRWWDNEKDVVTQILQDIADTDCGFLREGKGGEIVFEDRSHRFLSPHTVSQATYTNDTAGAIRYATIEPEDELSEIYNLIKCEVKSFNIQEESVVWFYIDIGDTETPSTTDPPVVPKQVGGVPGTLTLWAEFPTPNSATNAIAIHEWTLSTWGANSQADGLGTDMSPGGTNAVTLVTTPYDTKIKFVFTNTDTVNDAYIPVLYQAATTVVLGDPVTVEKSDAPSLLAYDEREFTIASKFTTSIQEATGFCNYFLSAYKDARAAVRLTLWGNHSTNHLNEVMNRDISDRITIVADSVSGLYMSGDYFVERIEHQVQANGIHTMALLCSAVGGADWTDFIKDYTPKTVPIPTPAGGETLPVPDDLVISGYSTQTRTTSIITVICKAKKWNAAIDTGTVPTLNACQCRAKFYGADSVPPKFVDLRTAAEGGTFAHNGDDQRIWTNIPASYEGAAKSWTYDLAGTWFIAMRLMNDSGWSVWTDGNDTPERVTFTIKCKGTPAEGEEPDLPGPPAQWSVSWKPASTNGNLIATVTRPRIHGERIFMVGFQVRGPGEWLPPDAANSPGYVSFDGSACSFRYSDSDPLKIYRNNPPGTNNWGTAKIGDIAWVDVRDYAVEEATWNINYCIPVLYMGFGGGSGGQITAFGTPIHGDATYIMLNTQINIPGNFGGTDLRLKICNPMWNWMTGGYMGYLPTQGFGYPNQQPWEIYDSGDTVSGEWVSVDIPYDPSVPFANLSVRAFFLNDYSCSYDSEGAEGNAAGGRCINLTDEDPIVTDAGLAGEYDEKTFRWQGSEDRTLAAPVNAVCGQVLKWCFINTGSEEIVITLDSAFRVGKILPELERPFDVTGDVSYLPGRITEDENYSP